MVIRNIELHRQLLMLLLLSGACALYYEDGFDHYYTYSSESDILGLHNVTTVMKFRIRAINSTSEGSLNMIMVDSFIQYSAKGHFADNPLKWDLSKEFLFFVANDGLVAMVHHHPEDEHEVLSLKKVLASTLSAKVVIKNVGKWEFTSTEEDHAGTFDHEYKGERTSSGLKFQRTHTSSTNVLRSHNKTIHLDRHGTPVEVECVDNVTLHHHYNTITRKPMEGEEEIIDEQSAEFPKIGSVSKSKIKLEAKRLHGEQKYYPSNNLTRDKLLIKHKGPPKVSLDSVETDVRQNLNCIRRYENKFEANRTECVNNLRKLFMSVHDEDFLRLASKVLIRQCGENDTMCWDERSLFIDLVGGHGSPAAQKVFLELIVLQPNVSEEDMRRFLFHCIPLKNPVPEVVSLVEDLCHGEIEYVDGVTSLTKTGRRACLSLGALAKNLHETNVTVSDRIVERLEKWLEPHNETKTAEIIKPRQRRSVSQMERSQRKHIETKMVLLQSLGNAGKKRSLDHIKSYLEPNTGHTVWRRAAAHSLRHFKCNESLSALLRTAVHDEDDVVRQTAQKVLNKHPKSGNITREQENIVLSKNYTYEVVSRVKRGAKEILDVLMKGFSFRFEAPGIEWDKTIGTKDIGASMGLTIRNLVDLKLSLMEGHFLVDVYDGAFAEAHVAMLDFQVDIVKAFVCFKGHINYNLNILKDFGIENAQDLLNIYDKVMDKIVNPIRSVIDGFRDIIELFRDGTMTEIFNNFRDTIRNLPKMLGALTLRVRDFLKDLYKVAGSVVTEDLKKTIGHIRQYVDGIKEDVLTFYSNISASVAALPYLGKKIKGSFNLIIEAFKAIIDAPVQGFTAMTRAVSHIKTAVAMLIDLKDKVMETAGMVKGRVSNWMKVGKVVPRMLRRLETAYEKLYNTKPWLFANESTSEYSDGVIPMKSSFKQVREDFLKKWDLVMAPLQELKESAKPFLDQFKRIKTLMQGIKWAYKGLKDVIAVGKSLVQRVFGPKFHPKFLTLRSKGDDKCPPGMYPTTTNDHYQTIGVDLAFGAGQTIPCPVDSIVYVKKGNRIVLKPTETEFSSLEMVIDNIEILKDNIDDGKRCKAGQDIGKTTKTDICKDNFVHFAVRKAQNGTLPDNEYQYTDPSHFLDKFSPLSKWIQECMDYEFRFIGQSFDSGEADDGEPMSKINKLKRSFMDLIGPKEDLEKEMDEKKITETKRRSISGLVGGVMGGGGLGIDWDDDFRSDVKENANDFKDFFDTALFAEEDSGTPDVEGIANVKDDTVSDMVSKLSEESNSFRSLSGAVDNLVGGFTSLPTENAKIQPMKYLKRLFPSVDGGLTELAEELQKNVEKLCTMFIDAISSQHLCQPRCDCMGIVCTLQLPTAHKLSSMQVGFYLNLETEEMEVLYAGNLYRINIDGIDHEVDTNFKVLGMSIKLILNIKASLDLFEAKVEAKICSDMLQICFPTIEVFTDIKFSKTKPQPIDSKDCSPDGEHLGDLMAATGEVHNMSISEFINSLGDFGMLTGNVTDVFDRLNDGVSEELVGEPVDELGIVTVEFHDSVDFCISANIKIPTFEVTFFTLRQIFMVGPVPLGLGFGAGGALGLGCRLTLCIMTMKLKVTLMPWLGGKVWGDVAVDLGFARGGIRLIGYLLETKFPITGELAFTKFPIDLGARLDLILIPIKLILKAFAELNFFIKTVTIFEGNIWEYAAPAINKMIFEKHTLNKDVSPPEILPTTLHTVGVKKGANDKPGDILKEKPEGQPEEQPDEQPDEQPEEQPEETERRKRADQEGCVVHQVLGRSHKDTAFELEMNAADPTSDVKISYCIGTHQGGTNLQDWTDIGGFSILQPAELPGGIPIYWTMKAKNSEGLEATAQCSLDTFDNTLPDGRVEHAYTFSSHRNKLIASVMVFDDSPLAETHYKAVGYSPGEFGSHFIDWQVMRLDLSSDRLDGEGNLKKFTVPRLGALIAPILQSQKALTPEDCASICLDHGSNCVSFDFEDTSQTCVLHDRVEGANAYLRVSGSYQNYERLGTGYHAPVEYTDLELKHGTLYFVNAKVTNVLGYEAYLFGEGTTIDLTPPEPGPVGEASQDILKADGCNAAITQRCVDVTSYENHRIIIDGPGAATIFNGHEPLVDNLYTLTNHYIAANWDGFHDDESGIYGYTWAVGTSICGTDILDFIDPHDHLSSRSFWTNSGFEKGFHLSDGAYYVTVQALNNAELGGSLVTTVCHSTPFIVDTRPPEFKGVTDIVYDEDFDLIAIYYEAMDDLSGIKKTEFGLGKTKYDVELRAYSEHPAMERTDPFVSVEDLGLQEGIPAWLRLRVTNNVGLFTAGYGDEPILIDRSPPYPGQVLDGEKLQRDIFYQSSDTKICAQWIDFYDSESGINSFMWGIGTQPDKDDIVGFKTMTRYEKSGCTAAALEHNNTYYSTVIAYNNALNSKPAQASSDGVLVDTTAPVIGHVVDGIETDVEDLMYTSETVTKACYWNGYSDPESGIEKYIVGVFVNDQLQETFDVKNATKFEDKTISLEHNDFVHFKVHGVNGAELSASADSDGFLVDHTPPVLVDIADTEDGFPYQNNDSAMHLMWHYRDDESGIKEFRTVILEAKEGIKQKIWPIGEPFNLTVPETKFPGKTDLVLDNLSLKNGGKYSLHVTSLNGALLSTAHESVGVTVDMTAPNKPKVHIGLLHEDEDLNEEGQVIHSDQHGILVSWSGRDSESGIVDFFVAVGKMANPEGLLPFTSYGTRTSSYINNIYLEPSQNSSDTYVVSVKAANGAGLISSTGVSKPIYVHKANVAGVVFDGRTLYEDEKYTIDRTSLAGSFYGFESDSCNIQGYEYAVGTKEFGSDIQTYTRYGVVMEDETHGYMQFHKELHENSVYFLTVRAVTGCRGEFIVASSNGITLDTKSPVVTFTEKAGNDTMMVLYNGVYYQDTTDSIHLTATVEDAQEVKSTMWGLGSYPEATDLHHFTKDLSRLTNVVTITPGAAVFLTASTIDGAGNTRIISSLPIIGDVTPPHLWNLECTKHASTRQGVVKCKWDKVVEYESVVKDIFVSIGTEPQKGDIVRDFKQTHMKLDYRKDLTTFLKKSTDITALYIDFKIVNIVGRVNEYLHKIIVDRTPPVVEGVRVVTRTNDAMPYVTMKCQLPTSFVEISVESIEDEESGIDEKRYEVALGSNAFSADIMPYKKVTLDSNKIIFIHNLALNLAQKFHATVRSYNKAGLNGESSSGMVVVSQQPFLEVIDGAGDIDVDFQPSPNIIQGSWKYSDDCPITEVSWKIEDLLGRVVSDYRPIPENAHFFFDDDVKLRIGVKYFIWVKTFDAMNRTKIARSDGVTARIQPPYPGTVRDGLGEDINYQFLVSELSANWDDFGDTSNDPTQSIVRYEVAIGNDLRHEETRANVHYFVDVGLNKSYTFTNLNLTAKAVTFYITVRAHSFAGGVVESFSNGIKVGFDENIIPGSIVSDHYQSLTDSIEFSWSEFQSDIGIMQYIVGISSQRPFIIMDSLDCSAISTNTSIFDIAIENVGLNEYVKVDDLNLNHSSSYYPSVIAEDESGMCSLITGHSIIIDTTLPEIGNIYINHLLSDMRLFALSSTELEVSWTMFDDPESGIESVIVTLLDCGKCDADHSSCFALGEEVAQNDTDVNFYELQLIPNNIYKVKLTVVNGADSSVEVYSKVILLDWTPPHAGVVKITDDWALTKNFQYKKDSIHGKLALTLSEDIYKCSNQLTIYPTVGSPAHAWRLLDRTYSKDFYEEKITGGYLGIGYNADLSEITRSGILSSSMKLRDGNYSSVIRGANGPDIVTTLAFVWTPKVIPYDITNKPVESDFDASEFANKTGLTADDSNQAAAEVAVQLKETNVSRESNTSYFSTADFGYGIHLLGYKIKNNSDYHGLFWAQSKYAKIERWFQLDFDPTEDEHTYTIFTEKYIDDLEELTDLKLLVDGVELVDVSGLELGNEAKVALITWNENGSRPKIPDVFNPFYSEAFVKYIEIPNEVERECRNGTPFFDGESGIKEIWVGVSDNITETENVAPLQLVKQFCPSCRGFCNDSCGDQCDHDEIDSDYLIIDLYRTGLNLKELTLDDECLNVMTDGSCDHSTSYYITIKAVNFAGHSTFAYSNAIQIDITPPTCNLIKCLDPEYADDEPVEYLGSSSQIGSYWNCTDDISLIDHYDVLVEGIDENVTIMAPTNVGPKSRVKFDFGNGTFKHSHEYMVKTEVVNTAGMSASYDCEVRAYLTPPDIQDTVVTPINTSPVQPISAAHLIETQNSVGIKWDGGKEDAAFYEWQLGTKPKLSDIFPAVLVGVAKAGVAAIVNGVLELEYESASYNKTLMEFRPQDAGTVNLLNKTSLEQQTFFSMEPGRCVYNTMKAIGYSHLKSTIDSKPVCVKRPEDCVLQPDPIATNNILTKRLSSNTWSQGADPDPELVVKIDAPSGSVIGGTVTSSDRSTPYGTAASTIFKPYISDPAITRSKTSRMLRKRIKQFCDVSFFLAPAPSLTYNNIDIDITVPEKCKGNDLEQPALVNWNTGKEEWQHEEEGCNPDLAANVVNGVYKLKVCSSLRESILDRKKRSTSTTSNTPTHYELLTITKDFINNPPNITTEVINTVEDAFEPTIIETVDPEDDDLLFEILEMPAHANCSLDSSGLLNCTFEEDYYGDSEITINVTETNLLEGIKEHSVQKTIPIHISPVRDYTDRYFVDPTGKTYTDKRPRMHRTFYTDANTTELHHAGFIILGTTDKNEMFDYETFTRFIPLGSSSVNIVPVQMYKVYAQNLTMLERYATVQAYNISFSYSKQLSGQMTLAFIATTKKNSFTPSITIDMYVLKNPCVHGVCSHVFFGTAGCHDISRSLSFDEYNCICDVGYTDQWCQTNIDECALDPCSWLFDCEDLVISYKCNVNVPKLMAIILCPLLVIAIIVFIIYRVKKHNDAKEAERTRLMQVQGMSDDRDEPNPLYRRPQISREPSEGDDPPFGLFTNKPKIDSIPGGSEMSSMFGLGMKTPTHMLLNLRKGHSNKVGVITEDTIATNSRDSPPPPPVFDDHKPRESVTPLSKKEEKSKIAKPVIPTCLSKEAEALFLEQHERLAKATDASSSVSGGTSKITSKAENSKTATSSSTSKSQRDTSIRPDSKQYDSSAIISLVNENFQRDSKSTGGSVSKTEASQAPVVSESEKKPSSAGSKTEISKPVNQAIPVNLNKEAAALSMDAQPYVVKPKSPPIDIPKQEIVKVDSLTPKTSPFSPKSHEKKVNDLSTLTKTKMPESSRVNSFDDEGFESDASRSLEVSVGSNNVGPTTSDGKNILDLKHGSSTFQSSAGESVSENRHSADGGSTTLRDGVNLKGTGSKTESPVNVLNVQQAHSTLPRAKGESTSDSSKISSLNTEEQARPDANSGPVASMIKSDMAVESKITKLTGFAGLNTESSDPLIASGNLSLGPSSALKETEIGGPKQRPHATLRPLDSLRTPKPPAALNKLQGTPLQAKELKRTDLVGPPTTLKVPAVEIKLTAEKLSPHPESTPRKVPLQTETHFLKLPQIDAKQKPKPGAPLAKNYLKGAPPTTLKFEKEPDTTKKEQEKRTKIMAKQFASLSLTIPGKPGGSGFDQSKAAKPKTAAKKKEKKAKKVAPTKGSAEETMIPEEDKQAKSNNGTPTSTSIGSQERPSSAVSDVDV